ncbi:hypothetical protein [Bacillus mycoides]|uniref:hypothetical protein n=1 Tax=Bacillus mycoides TaxID=1405 RepID=UPI003D66040B
MNYTRLIERTNDVYVTYEWQTIKGATSEGVGDALYDFFGKCGEDHTDLRKGDDK